jgi:hypothetical protein
MWRTPGTRGGQGRRRDGHASAGAGLVRSLLAGPAFGPLRGLLLALAVVTGVVDAVSILRRL